MLDEELRQIRDFLIRHCAAYDKESEDFCQNKPGCRLHNDQRTPEYVKIQIAEAKRQDKIQKRLERFLIKDAILLERMKDPEYMKRSIKNKQAYLRRKYGDPTIKLY